MTIVMTMKQTEGKEWVGRKGGKGKLSRKREKERGRERERLGWGWRFRALLFAV